MSQMTIWYLLHLKRWLKKPLLILWCIAFPLLMLFIHDVLPQDTAWTQIYIVDEDETETSQRLMDSLIQHEDSFNFLEADSFDDAMAKVQKQEIPLFIVLEEGLENFVSHGEQDQPIAIYSGTEYPIDSMITEIVFAHWFDITAGEILIHYMETLPEITVDIHRLTELDKIYAESDKIFSLTFEWEGGEKIEGTGFFPSPMTVLLSLTAFISMILIQLLIMDDRKRGIYGAFPLHKYHQYGMVASLAYFTPWLVSSSVAYLLTVGTFGLDFVYWLLYNATVWFFTYAFCVNSRNKNFVISTIPLWVTGAIATAPGFWNWSSVESFWSKLPYLFPPSYIQWAWRGEVVKAFIMMGILLLISVLTVKFNTQTSMKKRR